MFLQVGSRSVALSSSTAKKERETMRYALYVLALVLLVVIPAALFVLRLLTAATSAFGR